MENSASDWQPCQGQYTSAMPDRIDAALDCAVWAAYGWPADGVPAEVPAEILEDTILARLLALNVDRSRSSS